MGDFFFAERDDDEVYRRVAIELLGPRLISSQEVKRFLLERRVLARLEHPYIARLHDAGKSGDG